jgi:hypothetical protein
MPLRPEPTPVQSRLTPCPTAGCSRGTLRPGKTCCHNCTWHRLDPETYPAAHSLLCNGQAARDALALALGGADG